MMGNFRRGQRIGPKQKYVKSDKGPMKFKVFLNEFQTSLNDGFDKLRELGVADFRMWLIVCATRDFNYQ